MISNQLVDDHVVFFHHDCAFGDLLLDETSWPGSLHAHAGTGCGGVCHILWLSNDLAIMEWSSCMCLVFKRWGGFWPLLNAKGLGGDRLRFKPR